MVTVEVINTGTELTLGRVINTHLAYLAQSLFSLGLRVNRQATVPDGNEIREAFRTAVGRAQLIILTGGLGPTSDDITRDIVSEVMNRPLAFDPKIWAGLESYFSKRGREMNEMQKRQAMVPEGGLVLDNPSGTAPGLIVPFQSPDGHAGAAILLPGPPHELRDVWEQGARPWLTNYFKAYLQPVEDIQLRILGIGEAQVELKLEKPARDLGVAEVGYCARPGEVDLRFIGPRKAIEAAAALARIEFGPAIYTEGQASMEQVVNQLARAKKKRVAVAESCTGGLIANRITNVPFASEMFAYGWITYSNESKMTELGVDPLLLEEHGAVSEPVTRAMAEGALRRSEADLALAITGWAGTGGIKGFAEDDPAGTVHLALAQRDRPTIHFYKKLLRDREVFKYMASQIALNMIRRALVDL